MHPHSSIAQLDLDAYRQQAEWAWAAGLFEGEGSIVVQPTGNRRRWPFIKLILGMTDEDIVKRFAALVGVGAINVVQPSERPSGKPYYKTMFYWSAFGWNALPVLRQLLPWLGDRRGAKAREALALGTTLFLPNRLKTHCPKGHPYSPENTAFWVRGGGKSPGRHCRICGREANRASRARRVQRQRVHAGF